jgi:hypothetical protein
MEESTVVAVLLLHVLGKFISNPEVQNFNMKLNILWKGDPP